MPIRAYKAQVFTSKGLRAIRLPKALRLRGKIVHIQKTKAGLLVIDSKPHAERIREFAKLFGSCPDFPENESTSGKAKRPNQDTRPQCRQIASVIGPAGFPLGIRVRSSSAPLRASLRIDRHKDETTTLPKKG